MVSLSPDSVFVSQRNFDPFKVIAQNTMQSEQCVKEVVNVLLMGNHKMIAR